MKKLRIALLSIALLVGLTGCDFKSEAMKESERKENKITGTFKQVKVVNKKANIYAKSRNEYIITVQKGDQKVKLTTKGEDAYNAIQKGNVLTVGYNKDFVIQKITFDEMEKTNEWATVRKYTKRIIF